MGLISTDDGIFNLMKLRRKLLKSGLGVLLAGGLLSQFFRNKKENKTSVFLTQDGKLVSIGSEGLKKVTSKKIISTPELKNWINKS